MKAFIIPAQLLVCLFFYAARGQSTFPENGIPTETKTYTAYIHANIQVSYNQSIRDATLLIQDNKIIDVGNNILLPKDCVIKDLNGSWIYPSFIEVFSNYGIKYPEKPKQQHYGPKFISDKAGAYSWNEAIHPELHAADYFAVDEKRAEQLRAMGFGISISQIQDGIMRGTSLMTMLGNEKENKQIVKPVVTQAWSFQKGSSKQDYPSSLMGSIALIRQTLYDAQWYKNGGNEKETNLSLQALNSYLQLPVIFEGTDEYDILRASKIANEFKLNFIIKGNGAEYQIADDIKQTNACVIVPLTYPLPYDVSNPIDASYIPLVNLKHWELAPYNTRILFEKNIPFIITASGCKNEKEFFDNLRKAVALGLPEDAALKALLFEPARRLNIADLAGALNKNMPANFFISTYPLFSSEFKITSHIINGVSYDVKKDFNDVKAGQYRLMINKMAPLDLLVKYKDNQYSGEISFGEAKYPVSISYAKPNISLTYSLNKDSVGPLNVLTGYVTRDTMKGFSTLAYGSSGMWSAQLIQPEIAVDTTAVEKTYKIPSLMYPFQAFGFDTLPKPKNVLFKNATVWTNEKDGILRNTDVLIINGKISAVGQNLSSSGAQVIDATGKHLTSGIIDEHSHIAIYKGVNEGTQSVTAEVRIGDVLLPNDVNIYRQLAGGVTSSHLLHGSANAIGGQTQLIKLRWGSNAEAMKFNGWPGFIKFALGENVKQSNWGDQNTVRFPQTRMGVEQLITDAFNRARAYEKEWSNYNQLSPKAKAGITPPRRDLELDALVEILNQQRFITCHSYVQSEINMLMHIADTFGFKVNTFTHILEGYKLADKMKAHGAGASSFSDWWAYKYEVIDAIPHNGALLNNMGVITAFNSDDAEMARRLNQEAAKGIMYGGLSEEDAWKLVTLNPAKLLHVNQYTGSIAKGKDADIVIWSDNPLSIYSRCEQTYVDGICYFNLERNEKLDDYIQAEKKRLIQKMNDARSGGSQTQPISISVNQLYHCDTEGQYVK